MTRAALLLPADEDLAYLATLPVHVYAGTFGPLEKHRRRTEGKQARARKYTGVKS